MLPSVDRIYLEEHFPEHTISNDRNMICVLLPNFELPPGFDQTQSDLLLRLPPGYPDVGPDMWWFDPEIRRVDRQLIQATDVSETHLGRRWQRWSRHLKPGQWCAGIDSIQSYLTLIRSDLESAVLNLTA